MLDLNNARAFSLPEGTPESRLAVVERLTLDLMMELSARQAATLNESVLEDDAAGVTGPQTNYGKAYLETAGLFRGRMDLLLDHWKPGLRD